MFGLRDDHYRLMREVDGLEYRQWVKPREGRL